MADINKNPPWFRTASQCKYSGLPVSHPDLYISDHPGTNYFVDVATLGDQILLMKESGYVRSYEMSEALLFLDDYLATYFDTKTGVFFIEDYTDVVGADSKARKIFIEYLKNSNFFWGGILYNLPAILRISFNIAKRLHIHGEHLYALNSYAQAIALAQELVCNRNAGNLLCRDNDADQHYLPIETPGPSKTIFRRVAGDFRNFSDTLFRRFRKHVTRQYSEALLKYIESIDWQKDGFEAPEINYPEDKSVRKVFDAISFIKSEIDDLLKERDRAEQVLRESESRYRQLIEHAKAGILEFDYEANRIISVNDSFLSISGYTKEEVFSMDPLDLMTEESKKIYLDRLTQRLSGKILSSDSAYQFKTKNGQGIWVLLNSNITYHNGLPRKADIVLTDITQLKQIENELMDYQSKLKQLSVQLSKSEESQRRQLASQLHEGVSQELFVAQLKLNVLDKSLGNPVYSGQIDEIREQIVKSIREIKGITHDLSPPVLYDLGLKEAVESLVKSVEAKYRLPVKARFRGSLETLAEDIKIVIYRVLKEIIHNAIKHARADSIDVIIEIDMNFLNVDVIDNGIGFDLGSLSEGQYTGKGFGLFDIREKITHLGGQLSIRSTPGSGTRISLTVPLNEPEVPFFKS